MLQLEDFWAVGPGHSNPDYSADDIRSFVKTLCGTSPLPSLWNIQRSVTYHTRLLTCNHSSCLFCSPCAFWRLCNPLPPNSCSHWLDPSTILKFCLHAYWLYYFFTSLHPVAHQSLCYYMVPNTICLVMNSPVLVSLTLYRPSFPGLRGLTSIFDPPLLPLLDLTSV